MPRQNVYSGKSFAWGTAGEVFLTPIDKILCTLVPNAKIRINCCIYGLYHDQNQANRLTVLISSSIFFYSWAFHDSFWNDSHWSYTVTWCSFLILSLISYYFLHFPFCDRIHPGRRPILQPWRPTWFWSLTALFYGLPECRGPSSPIGRFHQLVPPSQSRLPLWTRGPWRHQWTVWLWLWWPVTSFGGRLEVKKQKKRSVRANDYKFRPSPQWSGAPLKQKKKKKKVGVNILWTHHCQKCSVFIVGVWRNVLCIVLIVIPEIPP